MVDYKDGEIKDIVPYNLLSPEVQAVSFAIAEEKKRLLKYAAATTLYAMIDEVPEPVLDLMALELNTQYYEQSLPRETKERLVSQTLVWYMHAGTPSVLDEFLGTVLAGGYIEEWYEYGGEPYYFKAYARIKEDDDIPLGYGKAVKQKIEIYKNARSWLESFAFILLTWYQVKVTYSHKMELMSEFYSRYNREFLFLDGTWKLDGTYKLNGYKELTNMDLYPLILTMRDDCSVESLANIMNTCMSRIDILTKTEIVLEMLSIIFGEEKMQSGICLQAGAPVELGEASTERTMGEVETDTYITGRMNTVSGCVESMSGSASGRYCAGWESGVSCGCHLKVEKNLWYLNGTYLLDGSTKLNAEIINYEL